MAHQVVECFVLADRQETLDLQQTLDWELLAALRGEFFGYSLEAD